MNIAVCDDEKIVTTQIESIIYNICKKEHIEVDIDVFYCGTELAKEILKGKQYDLIYLDIRMRNGNGITAAEFIRKKDENVIIIFVSKHDEYMGKLFHLNGFEFIKKPIQKEFFKKVFMDAYKKILSGNVYFTFRYKSQEIKIPCKGIMYFESKGRQISIHIENGDVYVFNSKLGDVEMKLQEGKIPFLRIHQSYLVNYFYIRERSKTDIVLVDSSRLPISKERKNNFSEKYNCLLNANIK